MVPCNQTTPSCLTLDASAAILHQCAEFIMNLDPEVYRRPCIAMGGSCIGQHVRHCLDHFTAALSAARGVIDYDHRERDTPIERDPTAALAAIHELIDRLSMLTPADLPMPVRVRVMLTEMGDEAELGSTLERELAFAAHHAVHHHAMISAIACWMGVATPDGFGRAPSTRHHERSRASG